VKPLLSTLTLALITTTAMAQTATDQQALAAAAKEPGAVVTPSGLVYRVLDEGTGPRPALLDRVRVRYKGTLADGKVFDSTLDRPEPMELPLNRTVKCWIEGIQRMHVGGKYKLTCPGALGYGPAGVPGDIPPNATLSFEVELVGIRR
jgi:FKBP-type peptidyl-prolyl cis-trans isomerase FkpA